MLLLALILAVASPLTVPEIVAKHVEARGGASKLAAVQSLRLNGKMLFGPAPNSMRGGSEPLSRRLTLERARQP